MKRWIPLLIALAIVAAALTGYLLNGEDAAREAQSERPVPAAGRVAAVNGASVVTVDAAAQRASGIETESPRAARIRPEIDAYAAVLDAAGLSALRNRYVAATARLATAEAKLAASKTAYERARSLYGGDRDVSLAQLQAAEAAYRADAAAVSAGRAERRGIADAAAQDWGARLGRSLVRGGPLAARFTARRALLLQVTLPPGIVPARPPERGEIETPQGSRTPIVFVSDAPRTDPRIQGASYFYSVRAGRGVLAGMNLLAHLPRGRAVTGVVVPATAVVWRQGRAWIYRRTGADSFTRVPIPTDLPAPGGGYLVRDLPEAGAIVTRGAQLLLSEEFRAAAQPED